MGVHLAVTFLFTTLLMIAWPFVVQAKMFADCTFGKVNTTEGQKMTANFTAKLAAFKHFSHSCFVETDGENHQNRFLQVRVKRNNESEGFLHVSAYGKDDSRILGHLDVSTFETDWSSLIVCPSRYSNEVQEKHLTFSGSPSLSFTVQINSSPQEIKLNEPQTVTVTPENVQIFQFFPPEDIAKTQLDVTVTSESADVPAYLKVSGVCKEVDKDGIDEVDYKRESIRLSFAKKGRITLSKVSVPPLTDSTSSWFIGIAIKNATGETPFNATKSVTLELNKSFDFSYAGPLCFIILVPIICGFVIVFCACMFFEYKYPPLTDAKETRTTNKLQLKQTETNQDNIPPGDQSKQSSSKNRTESSSESSSRVSTETDQVNTQLGDQSKQSSSKNRTESSSESSSRVSTETDQVNTQLGDQSKQSSSKNRTESSSEENEETPLINSTKETCCSDCLKVCLNWLKHGPETYSYTASIAGFMLMIGASQFVFANWHLMKEEGDRDNCYYNDFCYRVSEYHDIPLNLMISNLVYIWHGLILGIFVYCMGGKWESEPAKRAISIGHAFAWAMTFEGLFSLVYHLCPSKLTFQFDTAFMFVIAGLIVISLYDVTAENPVGAANFFLYFLVPLFIFNYLGALRHSEGRLPTPLEICFYIGLAIWFICICFWAGYKVIFADVKCDGEFVEKIVFILLFALVPVVIFVFVLFCFDNRPEFFLFSCIAEAIIAISGKGISLCRCPSHECLSSKRNVFLAICQFLYVVVMVLLWIGAFCVFLGKATTDKAETPENSRNLNHECYFLDFYDYHDLWHILSSHALLMTVCLVIAMSCK